MLSNLFFILLAALIGGLAAKLVKLPSLVGYILAGVVGGLVLALDQATIQNIAEFGVILLLFSVGLEVSFEKLIKVGKIAIIGSIIQIVLVSAISFLFLTVFFGITGAPAIVLSIAFSFSSTALIVKIMSDKGETGTIHYEIMTSWSLVQDLAVIPVVVLLPTLAMTGGSSSLSSIAIGSILTTVLILGVVLLMGKLIGPYLTHLIAETNSREFLLLLAITLALGTATLVSLFGISAAFGAFLAGLVISKTQENHAIFSETRPLRDIFSILFFVSLGFLVTPSFIISHLITILILSIFVIIIKALVTFFLCIILGVRGRTAVSVSLGLAQVGEFAFVLFLIAEKLGILSTDLASIGMATTLVTLLISSLLFKEMGTIWQKLRLITSSSPALKKYFVSGNITAKVENELADHIIICGYGRMGRWIGKALKEIGVEFIVIDYNHKTIRNCLITGTKAIYGDASLPEVLEAANIKKAKAVIITLPDVLAQQEIIEFCKLNFPKLRIMARAHLDSDMKKLSALKIHKIIQPEFEGALAVVKNILVSAGHDKKEIDKKMKGLRLSHASL